MRRMYIELFSQMKKMLGQVDGWLSAAEAHAKAKSFDPTVFLGLRLAPDQFPFARQLQITCDTARLGAARLTGKEETKHEDTEKTRCAPACASRSRTSKESARRISKARRRASSRSLDGRARP